jgi:DNA invertase Pin-like site-specific DNA recombinase
VGARRRARLKRIGRSQQHLLELVRWFGAHDVDFVVQGIAMSSVGRRFAICSSVSDLVTGTSA